MILVVHPQIIFWRRSSYPPACMPPRSYFLACTCNGITTHQAFISCTVLICPCVLVDVHVGYEKKFAIESASTSQGLPYEFESVMHFRHYEYSRNFRATILPGFFEYISPLQLGSSTVGTELDFLHIRLLYCGGRWFIMYLV